MLRDGCTFLQAQDFLFIVKLDRTLELEISQIFMKLTRERELFVNDAGCCLILSFIELLTFLVNLSRILEGRHGQIAI